MKILIHLLTLLILPVLLFAQNNQSQLTKDYIEKYKGIAIREMKRTGVPASITLAQAIVESASGESNLAKKFNNHFGIKCKLDWKGQTTYQNDDTKNECFRVYPSADSSFIDHSNFIKYRPNYANLFELDPVDDTAWAYGLKKAGYATERDYPAKLLKTIDDYELAQYNFPELVAEDSAKQDTALATKDTTIINSPIIINQVKDTLVKNTIVNDTVVKLNSIKGINANTTSQLSMPVMNGVGKITADTVVQKISTPILTQSIPKADTLPKKEIPNFPINQKFKINQSTAIWANKDRSFLEIANTYNVALYKLYKYNELPETDLVQADQIIFITEKRKESNKKVHIVKIGETIYDISQIEGIQLEALKAYNNNFTNNPLKEGSIVYLFNMPKDPSVTPVAVPNTPDLKQKIKGLINIPFLKSKNN